MGKRVSVKRLAEILNEAGYETTAVKLKGNCERYGNDTRCYFYTDSAEERRQLERVLTMRHGVKVFKDYWPGSGALEIGVTFIKNVKSE